MLSPLAPTDTPPDPLVEAIPAALIGVRRDGTLAVWNRAAERAFRLPATETIGRRLSDLPVRWGDDRLDRRVAEADHRPGAIEDLGYELPDGTRGVLRVLVNPVAGAEGKPALSLFLAEDRTERRALEAQLTQAQKLESIGQLAAGVAHEINTPIQYIGDNTHFLKEAFDSVLQAAACIDELIALARRADPTAAAALETRVADCGLDFLRDQVPEALDHTLQGVKHVAGIVRAMKEFSHPGSDEKTPFELNRAVETTVTVTRNEWKYVAHLDTALDPDLPKVLGFPGDINQALLNLIVNASHAIQAAGKGESAKGNITITTRVAGEFVEVAVRDDGCGIPPAVRHRIFDPFFTTKPIGKGTGQGLAIVHAAIVKRHGGTVRVDSEVGKGTTFTLALPRTPAAPEGVP